MISLMTALAGNTMLKVLNLNSVHQIGNTGWIALTHVLQNSRHLGLRELHLHANCIHRDVVLSFANALTCNTSLEELYFGRTNHIDDEVMFAFASAFSTCDNSTLKRLYLGCNSPGRTGDGHPRRGEQLPRNINVTSIGWAALSRVLCDQTSINSTFNSNHTLEIRDIPNDESSNENSDYENPKRDLWPEQTSQISSN